MSAVTTPNDSPVSAPIQPLHNPSQAAHVVVPQAPLGNATNGVANQVPGMGVKALLAKKLAKSKNPTYISPTDKLMTPVTQKLNAAKQKRFTKGAKLTGALFPITKESTSSEEREDVSDSESLSSESEPVKEHQDMDHKMNEDDNPF